MGIAHSSSHAHWNYFLALEADLAELARWVEFSPSNETAYSIEMARLLMAAAAEADVVAKMLCAQLDPKAKAESINKYQAVLVAKYPMIPTAKVHMPRFGLTLSPWSEWSKASSPPLWWTGNNKVKHHRESNFAQANLKNVLNAAAGLLLLLALHYAQSARRLTPAPSLMHPKAFASVSGRDLVLNPGHG
jgi:hypothetical protein